MVFVLMAFYVLCAVGYAVGVMMVDDTERGVMPTWGRMLAMALLNLLLLPFLLGFSTGVGHAREVGAFLDHSRAWRTTRKEEKDA